MNLQNIKKLVNWLSTYKGIFIVWMSIACICLIIKIIHHKINNYLIFKYVFWHTWDKIPLYIHYPAEYADLNHYGPFFSILIAPFAILPDWLGSFLYVILMVILLFWSIKKLPLNLKQHVIIYWFALHELILGVQDLQFNIMIASCLIWAFVFVEKKKEQWATFFIVLGMFVKLYGIVGLPFFFFSQNKKKFILWFFFWSILFFVLPMLISSPGYIIQEYVAWYTELIDKNQHNISFAGRTDISVMGMFRRILTPINLWDNMYTVYILLTGCIISFISIFPFKKYINIGMRLRMLVAMMLFVILFSTGSEPSSYLICFVGIGIWFSMKKIPFSTAIWIGLLTVFIFGSFSYSDLFPHALREFIRAYALKALPSTIIWGIVCYELICYKSYLTQERQ